MRLIDADALKENFPSDAKLTIGHYTFINNSVGVNFVRETIDNAPTIDAVSVDYIIQRADALKDTDEYGARVLYGLVMNWNGEEQNDE